VLLPAWLPLATETRRAGNKGRFHDQGVKLANPMTWVAGPACQPQPGTARLSVPGKGQPGLQQRRSRHSPPQ